MRVSSRGARVCALVWGLLGVACDDPLSRDAFEASPWLASAPRGIVRGPCQRDAECGGAGICSTAYGRCVRPCVRDADCTAPSRCLLDRLEVDFCGCEGPHCDWNAWTP